MLYPKLRVLTPLLAGFLSACGGSGGSENPVQPGQACDGSVQDGSAGFNDVTATAGLCFDVAISAQDGTPARLAGGVAVRDIDADGIYDLYLTPGRNTPGKLLKGQGTDYVDITEASGISVQSVDHAGAFVDLDGDGLPDLLSVQGQAPWLQVFRNRGDGTFIDRTGQMGPTLTKVAYSVAAGDYDLDGDLDLFFAHYNRSEKQDRWEFLWQNQGSGSYQDVSDRVAIEPFEAGQLQGLEKNFSFTPIFADSNNNAYPDLLIASDFRTSQVLQNNSGDSYLDPTPNLATDRAGMGAAVADYDNDGDLDWFVSAIGDKREEFLTIGLFDGNRLYRNEGGGNFVNATDEADVRQGFWAWGSCFADLNNDGYEDLFIVNGYDGMTEEESLNGGFSEYRETSALLYINQGDGTFQRGIEQSGIRHTAMGRGLACFDYDRDGDVDLLVVNNGQAPNLYRNDNFRGDRNFVNVSLTGLPGNELAVGARIYVTAGELNMMRELQLGNHYVSQNPVEAHFGLDGNERIDEIRVVWPGRDRTETLLTDLDANQFIRISHPSL